MHDNKYDRINTIASKEADRQHVEARMAAFFAAGGHVHQVGTTASANRGHGYPVRLDMREIADYLADADECEHCRRAWALILKRKEVRQELGAAKRAIRSLGRAALKRESA